MKNHRCIAKFLTAVLCATGVISSFAQVGFNNPTPAPSSILDLKASDKGLLVPRMTTAQRQAIANPANGLMVFDLTLKAFCYYDTISNPDKWMLLGALKADASGGHTSLIHAGNLGVGTDTPSQKLEVVGNIKCSDTVVSDVGRFTQVISNNYSGNGTVPAGAIILWYGTTPPTGWVICDGSNGTPDLRGRFVLGSGTNSNPAAGDINPTYTVGATGGENKHTLTKSELPKHKHTVTNAATDNGQVTLASTTITDTYPAVIAGGPVFFTPNSGNEIKNITNVTGHTHTISGSTGDGTTDGITSQAQENRPPYYVLTYIMKQ